MQEFLDQLNNIFEVLKKDVAPPITDAEFQKLSGRLPFKLPNAVESLYRWHNGINEFIPNYSFLSLVEAITAYEEIISALGTIIDESFFNQNHLPILQSQDSCFFVDCTPNSEQSIYYLASFEGEGILKKYNSLSQMLQIVVDAYLSRAYYVEADFFLENSVLFRKVEQKYLSTEELHTRELEWNRLCVELEELKNLNGSQELSAAETQLQELAAVLGLDAPTDLRKEGLISRLTYTYDERAIRFLVEFLHDENPEIIAKAAYGLGKLKARENLPELIQLTQHPAEVVRNLATHAIAGIVTPDDQLLSQPLLALLADEATLVRMAAASALGQLRDQAAVQPLLDLLQDSNSGVRYDVIQALGKIGDASAIEVLQRRKSDGLPDEAQIIDRAISLIRLVNAKEVTRTEREADGEG